MARTVVHAPAGTCWDCFHKSIEDGKNNFAALERGDTSLSKDDDGSYYIECSKCTRIKKLRDHADELCPRCMTSLQGDPIPEKNMHCYGASHFTKRIGIVDERRKLVEYKCSECGYSAPCKEWE